MNYVAVGDRRVPPDATSRVRRRQGSGRRKRILTSRIGQRRDLTVAPGQTEIDVPLAEAGMDMDGSGDLLARAGATLMISDPRA
jgi:hypothetical protein